MKNTNKYAFKKKNGHNFQNLENATKGPDLNSQKMLQEANLRVAYIGTKRRAYNDSDEELHQTTAYSSAPPDFSTFNETRPSGRGNPYSTELDKEDQYLFKSSSRLSGKVEPPTYNMSFGTFVQEENKRLQNT